LSTRKNGLKASSYCRPSNCQQIDNLPAGQIKI
jgi:hypothetical protein